MARYTARIYDKSKSLLAVLENTTGAHFARRLGQACEVGFGIPANDPKAALLADAMYFDLYRDEVRIASARIEKRDMDRNPYTVTGLTNEIKLRDLITPANWTYDGWEAMVAIRDLLLEFRTFVKQSQADWEAGERYQVDTTTQPTRSGDVILAKDSSGHYYASGYVITAPIDLGADVFKIDRIRWQQTVGEAVSITVQTRTGPTPVPDASWSAWSQEQGLAVPEESARTGVTCLSPTARYIQVKLNLRTTDTTTPSETGTTFGFTPILHACEVVARYRTELSAGAMPASINYQLRGVEFNYTNHLEAIAQICEKIGYEWEVDGDDKLNVAKTLGSDKSSEIVIREGDNAKVTVLRDSPGEVVNVVMGLGAGEGLAQLRVGPIEDPDSIGRYGRRPGGVYENRDITDPAALLAETQDYLARVAWPQPELQVDTIADAGWPPFRVGDTVRVVSPAKGIDIKARILEERRAMGDKGEIITLGLNTTLTSLIDVIVGKPRPLPPAAGVAPPTGLAVVSGLRALRVQWQGQADYFILEHSLDGVTWSLLEPYWPGRSYTHSNLAPGERHYYRVYAMRGGRGSSPAGPVSGVPGDVPLPDQLPPPTPGGIALTTGIDYVASVTLAYVVASWEATAADVAHYLVRWRRADRNVARPFFLYEAQVGMVVTGENWQYAVTSGTSQKISPLVANVPYEVQVRAVDGLGNASDWSASATITTAKDTTAPAPPAFNTYGGIVKGIFVVLNTPTDPDWDGFEIHVSETSPDFVPDASTLKARGKQTRFEVTGLVPGRTYYVKAIAFDTSGNKSSPSY